MYCYSLGVDLQMGCARHTTEGLATQAKSSKTDCSHLTLQMLCLTTDDLIYIALLLTALILLIYLITLLNQNIIP